MLNRISSSLSRYPSLKRGAKYLYQAGNFLLHFHTTKARSRFRIERISGNKGGFFGYYDKSPESADGRFVLYHEPKSHLVPGNALNIMVFDRHSGSRKEIGETRAWNLQAGSRLQWIRKDRFVYNIFDELSGEYGSMVSTLTGNTTKALGYPVYDISCNTFLCPDFRNLHGCGSEYGYGVHAVAEIPPPQVVMGDIETGAGQVILSDEEMRPLIPSAFDDTHARHFNHIMFNPGGSAFVFIFRWTGKKGRRDALVHRDMLTGKLRVMNEGMNSHFCWISDDTLFGYCSVQGQRGFYNLDVKSVTFDALLVPGLAGDGHPSSRHGIILLDSYPDSARMQHILLLHGSNLMHAGRFYAPLVYNEYYRCDLHPRFSSDGKRVYFDSTHEGKRHLYCIHLKEPDAA